MPSRPALAALVTAVAVAAGAGGALVAQQSSASGGPATPERAVAAFVDGIAAGDPATCALLTPEARAEAVADESGLSCEESVALLGRQEWTAGLAFGRPTVTSSGAGFAVVRFDLPDADVMWFRAVRGPQGWQLQRGPWDDSRSA